MVFLIEKKENVLIEKEEEGEESKKRKEKKKKKEKNPTLWGHLEEKAFRHMSSQREVVSSM